MTLCLQMFFPNIQQFLNQQCLNYVCECITFTIIIEFIIIYTMHVVFGILLAYTSIFYYLEPWAEVVCMLFSLFSAAAMVPWCLHSLKLTVHCGRSRGKIIEKRHSPYLPHLPFVGKLSEMRRLPHLPHLPL